MKIRTQFIMALIIFVVILAGISASIIITNQRVDKASQQQEIANGIAQGASELSYLSNDYLIYRESQQLDRWQTRYSSFTQQVASLQADGAEQQALLGNIQASEQRLKEVFDSTISTSPASPQSGNGAVDIASLQVSWSRIAVQTQGLVSDASRLAQLLNVQVDQLRQLNLYIIIALIGVFVIYFIVSYLLVQQRLLRSLAKLSAGTKTIGAGNLDFVIPEKRNDEVGDLSRAFNQMTANLKNVTASKADLEREIDERKKAQEALRASEQRWVTTLASIGDAVIATDTASRITFMNAIAEQLTGWKISEASGKAIEEVFNIVNEHTRQIVENPVTKVLQQGAIVGLANHTILIRKDSTEVAIDDSGAPIKTPDNRITGVVLVFRDITERRKTEREMAHLASFPKLNPSPIVEMDKSGHVKYVNPAADRLFPDIYTRQSQHPFLAGIEALAAKLQTEKLESLVREVNVDERWFEQTLTHARTEGGFRIYARDITARKKTEIELHEYREHLEQLVEERTKELERLSHRVISVQEEERRLVSKELHDETGQWLTVLGLMLARAEKRISDKNVPELPEAQDLVKKISKQIRDLSTSLHPGTLESLGLLPTLQWYFEEFKNRAGITINFTHSGLERELSFEMGITAYRIIQESLTNIVRYAGVKEARVEAEIIDNTLSLLIEDQGKGFDPKSVSAARLGLRGMTERARLLGGKLTIESRPGTGTKIRAELPLEAR